MATRIQVLGGAFGRASAARALGSLASTLLRVTGGHAAERCHYHSKGMRVSLGTLDGFEVGR